MSCRVEGMSHWSLAVKPERTAVFAEGGWRCGIYRLCHFNLLIASLGAQRGQNPLRGERRFPQPYSHSVVDSVGDSRDGSGKRAFARLFGSERSFGIDALDDDGLDFRRFNRRRADDIPAAPGSSSGRLSRPFPPAWLVPGPSRRSRPPGPPRQPDSARVRSRVPPRLCAP